MTVLRLWHIKLFHLIMMSKRFLIHQCKIYENTFDSINRDMKEPSTDLEGRMLNGDSSLGSGEKI